MFDTKGLYVKLFDQWAVEKTGLALGRSVAFQAADSPLFVIHHTIVLLCSQWRPVPPESLHHSFVCVNLFVSIDIRVQTDGHAGPTKHSASGLTRQARRIGNIWYLTKICWNAQLHTMTMRAVVNMIGVFFPFGKKGNIAEEAPC